MADNVIIPASGTGTATPNIATDDIGGVQHQRVKVEWGTDGTAVDVTTINPLPVQDLGIGTLTGGLTETAPASDTASSGLNGRLQRIAQNITTLLGRLPSALGQTTKAGSLSVTLASNQDALPVTDNAGSLTVDAPVGTPVFTRLSDGTTALTTTSGRLAVDGSGVTQPVSGTVTTTPPANASTNMAQVAGTATDTNSGNKSAGTQRVVIATDQVQLTNALKVDPSGVTSPVSAASLPLPAGASTEATLAAQTKVDNAAFTDGTTPVSPVGYIFDEVAGTALTENDVAAARIDSKRAQATVLEDATTRGQRATVSAGGALKVDGSAATQPVSGTVTTTPPSNASSNVAQINGVTPLMGAGNTGTGSPRVTIATDQAVLPVSTSNPVQAATATLANVSGSASSVTLQASNGSRKGLVIVNDSTAILYVKFGSSASTTSFTYYLAGSVSGVPATLELPATVYTGIVTGIWASAVGSARVTELT